MENVSVPFVPWTSKRVVITYVSEVRIVSSDDDGCCGAGLAAMARYWAKDDVGFLGA